MRMLAFSRHERGSVLIVTMIICLGLVAVVLLFANTAMMGYRGAENDVAGRQAEQAVEGGARYAMYLLSTAEAKGALPDAATYLAEDQPVGEAAFWFIGRSTDNTLNLTEPVYGLVDEASKLNLNNPLVTEAVLMKLPGMTEELAQAIVAWRSADGGSASDTYSQRRPPYRRKGAAFESEEELALLDGADLSLLRARDANLNGVLDVEENDSRDSLGTLTLSTVDGPGLLEYVTVFPSEPYAANAADGTPRVLATTVSQAVRDLLSTKLTADRVALIAAALNGLEVNSALEFFIRGGLTAEEFDSVADYLKFSEETAPTRAVNVNTASATVLKCIPGLEDKADEIVSARQSRSTATTSFGWLREYITDPEMARLAGPLVTGRSTTVCADVAAVGRHGRGYRRTRFVIDASGTTPRIIYRRNLGSLGWALGRRVRAALAEEKQRTR